MAVTSAPTAPASQRDVITLPISPGLVCLRGLSPQRLRFELEYALERGSTANSFLFEAGSAPNGQTCPALLVHPPEPPMRMCSCLPWRRLSPTAVMSCWWWWAM